MHPSLLRAPVTVKEEPVNLRILTDDVYITQANGRVVHPEVGVTVMVTDPAVAGALLKFGKAEEVGARKAVTQPVPEPVHTPLTESEMPEVPRTDAPQIPSPEAVKWGDIPGISETSLSLLMTRAPEQDPRTVTMEDLQKVLGSTQRAGYVHRAIQDYLAGKTGAEVSGDQ